jgi:hypothetical protein
VFDGPEDYHAASTTRRSKIDEHTMLFMRGAGPIGYPGAAEVVNMQPPAYLLKKGILPLPCIGDGRQSGTSGSPSILNASPEAAAGGGLAMLKTGDKVRIDLNKGTANILISDEELASAAPNWSGKGGYKYPGQPDAVAGNPARHGRPASRGMVLKPAVKYQRSPRPTACRATRPGDRHRSRLAAGAAAVLHHVLSGRPAAAGRRQARRSRSRRSHPRPARPEAGRRQGQEEVARFPRRRVAYATALLITTT